MEIGTLCLLFTPANPKCQPFSLTGSVLRTLPNNARRTPHRNGLSSRIAVQPLGFGGNSVKHPRTAGSVARVPTFVDAPDGAEKSGKKRRTDAAETSEGSGI